MEAEQCEDTSGVYRVARWCVVVPNREESLEELLFWSCCRYAGAWPVGVEDRPSSYGGNVDFVFDKFGSNSLMWGSHAGFICWGWVG
jgi:hypothetical protein